MQRSPACLLAVALVAGAALDASAAAADKEGPGRAGDPRRPGRIVAAVTDLSARDPRPPGAALPQPLPLARLHLVQNGSGEEAWAENLLDGPIEVMLLAGPGPAPASEPALPARATVPARSRVLVARIARAPDSPSGAHLGLRAVPGKPGIRARDIEYGYPLRAARVQVGQGWGGAFSHGEPENHHAVDLAAAVGTPVLAARDGVVMQLEQGFQRGGLGAGIDETHANFVRVLHDDGSMALYAHLDAAGVQVRQGQRVARGEAIGLSGNTGYSGGPHLHFVLQANQGMRLVSLPFRMFGPAGVLRFGDATP